MEKKHLFENIYFKCNIKQPIYYASYVRHWVIVVDIKMRK